MTGTDTTTQTGPADSPVNDLGRCFQQAHWGISDNLDSAVACTDHLTAVLTGMIAGMGISDMRVWPVVSRRRCDFRFDSEPRSLYDPHPDLLPCHDTGCGCGYHTARRERGAASCGHPANEDGECDCACWPERCTHNPIPHHEVMPATSPQF